MSKRITMIFFLVIFLVSCASSLFAQTNEPVDLRTREEKVANFISLIKGGDPDGKAFIFITYDIMAGIPRKDNLTTCGAGRTTNVIDTIRCAAAEAKVSFMDYLTDGEWKDNKSEKRKNVIMATLRGLYNLDPRIRLVAIEWLRLLRPDAMMFRDVERAVEYETVCSSYEKYRPKNIDIPSIDEPGANGTNIPFTYYDEHSKTTEKALNQNMTDSNGNKVPDTDNVLQTDPRPTATQLDARKWGNGNAWDPDMQAFEIFSYIDVMTQAGVLRRFRNVKDSYLLGYQYQLGTPYIGYKYTDYNKKYKNDNDIVVSWINKDYPNLFNYQNNKDNIENLTNPTIKGLTAEQLLEIINTMVPIGHGDKYYYRNSFGKDVIGNSWAELVKLREFIVRAIWYDKIKSGELNSLVIISKDTFKTLYLSIDGEVGYDIPFLATTDTTPGGPLLVAKDIPVLEQGLLKNPVYSTKWVIARALKDIYSQKATTMDDKKRINWILRQAKYDALSKDVISGAILHEELIKVGKIDITVYPTIGALKDSDHANTTNVSATFVGGIYVPRKDYIKVDTTVEKDRIASFSIPNDEVLTNSVLARENTPIKVEENLALVDKDKKVVVTKIVEDYLSPIAEGENPDRLYLLDRVIDAFTFYDYYVVDMNPTVGKYDWKVDANKKKDYQIRRVSNYDLTPPQEYGVNAGINSKNLNTFFNDREIYLRTKEVYYKYISDPTATNKYLINLDSVRGLEPHFNVEFYNKVITFIDNIIKGNNEIMANVEWPVVEAAQLLVMYRLNRMINSATVGDINKPYDRARLLTLDTDRDATTNPEQRISFFDAFSGMGERDLATVADPSYYGNVGVIKLGNTYQFAYNKEFSLREFEVLNKIADGKEVLPKEQYTASRRNNFVNATLPGLYNKDPRIRLESVHWLRRLQPSDDMFDPVRKALGIILAQDPTMKTLDDLDNKFNDAKRTDRPDTQKELAPFFDTNIYRRIDRNEFFDNLENLPDAEKAAKRVYLHPELIKGNYDGVKDANGFVTAKEGVLNEKQIRPLLYIVSQDFELFTYRPLGIDDNAEQINFYDMLPGYRQDSPDVKIDFPALATTMAPNADPILQVLQVITMANPLYTEDRYEYYFDSYGTYQYKSPIEELHKLYKLILRQKLVSTIKEGKEPNKFETMSRFEFRVLTSKIDDEYMLRIPMQSFFGLVGAGKTADGLQIEKQNLVLYKDFLNMDNGDFDTEYAFRMTKGKEIEYFKYPVFRETEISTISRGIKNSNFIIQKGCATYLIKFYNFYSNLEKGTQSAIKDSMYFYKNEDIVVEEITLAFEGENPEGRAVIKAGTKLGNDLNPGGVAQYKKNIPVEIRRVIRREINMDVQSFNNEISDILGIRRFNVNP